MSLNFFYVMRRAYFLRLIESKMSSNLKNKIKSHFYAHIQMKKSIKFNRTAKKKLKKEQLLLLGKDEKFLTKQVTSSKSRYKRYIFDFYVTNFFNSF